MVSVLNVSNAIQYVVSCSETVLWLTGWQKDYGGYTSYIAEGEDEEVGCLGFICPSRFLVAVMSAMDVNIYHTSVV